MFMFVCTNTNAKLPSQTDGFTLTASCTLSKREDETDTVALLAMYDIWLQNQKPYGSVPKASKIYADDSLIIEARMPMYASHNTVDDIIDMLESKTKDEASFECVELSPILDGLDRNTIRVAVLDLTKKMRKVSDSLIDAVETANHSTDKITIALQSND